MRYLRQMFEDSIYIYESITRTTLEHLKESHAEDGCFGNPSSFPRVCRLCARQGARVKLKVHISYIYRYIL